LQRELGSANSLAAKIRQRAAKAKTDDSAPHLRRPEEVFLNEYAIPCLFRELQRQCGLSPRRLHRFAVGESQVLEWRVLDNARTLHTAPPPVRQDACT